MVSNREVLNQRSRVPALPAGACSTTKAALPATLASLGFSEPLGFVICEVGIIVRTSRFSELYVC